MKNINSNENLDNPGEYDTIDIIKREIRVDPVLGSPDASSEEKLGDTENMNNDSSSNNVLSEREKGIIHLEQVLEKHQQNLAAKEATMDATNRQLLLQIHRLHQEQDTARLEAAAKETELRYLLEAAQARENNMTAYTQNLMEVIEKMNREGRCMLC